MDLIYISVAMSLDGKINTASGERLVISSREDLDSMYEARALCDAILVGASTIRKDDPSLLFKKQNLIDARTSRGQKPELIKVTVSNSGDIDPHSRFFTEGSVEKIVIVPNSNLKAVGAKLGHVAKILGVDTVDPESICTALEKEGVRTLFVEGGTSILTMFLSDGYFDKLRLAIGPFFVGEAAAPSFVKPAEFWNNKEKPLLVERVSVLGNVTVIEMKNVRRK